jgi:predicted nucleotidyltransferase
MVTRRQINELAKRVAERFRPQKIILFGSYAYGTPSEDSDVDLLVVMPVRGRMVLKAAEILGYAYEVTGSAFPLDVLVRTPTLLAKRIALNDFFLREVVEKGRVLYDAADARVGAKGGGRLRQRRSRLSRPQVAEL